MYLVFKYKKYLVPSSVFNSCVFENKHFSFINFDIPTYCRFFYSIFLLFKVMECFIYENLYDNQLIENFPNFFKLECCS